MTRHTERQTKRSGNREAFCEEDATAETWMVENWGKKGDILGMLRNRGPKWPEWREGGGGGRSWGQRSTKATSPCRILHFILSATKSLNSVSCEGVTWSDTSEKANSRCRVKNKQAVGAPEWNQGSPAGVQTRGDDGSSGLWECDAAWREGALFWIYLEGKGNRSCWWIGFGTRGKGGKSRMT